MNKNYYEILGVDKAAPAEDIKHAYRELSKQHHPDKGGDEEKFKEISEAYSVLSDPNKRADYDNPARNMGNPFGDMFRGFRHGDPFGGGPPKPPDPNTPRRGRNIVLEKSIPLKFFILGGKFNLKFSFRDACPDCSGTGAEEKETCGTCKGAGQMTEARQDRGVFMRTTRACPTCMGRGFTAKVKCGSCNGSSSREVKKDLTIDVPPNIGEGHVVGVQHEGHIGVNGGINGDLLVKLYIKLPKAEDLTDEQRKVLEEL